METHPSLPMEHSEEKCDLEIEDNKFNSFEQLQSTHGNGKDTLHDTLIKLNKIIIENFILQLFY